MIELKGKYNKDCKIFADDVEPEAISLIQSILDQPLSKGVPVRIQSDVHSGKGAVIGFTMPLTDMIDPGMIGVDLSCGIIAGTFKPDKPFDLEKIDKEIRKVIPMGFNTNETPIVREFPFDEAQKDVDLFVTAFNKKFNTNYTAPKYDEKWLSKKLKQIGMDEKVFWNSCGTLGGGNHYNELGVNELGEHMYSIHSGSRNFGLKIANYHMNQSKKQVNFSQEEYAKKLDNIVQNTENKKDIPKLIKSLKEEMNVGVNRQFLQGEFLIDYLFDTIFANQYARLNRRLMLEQAQKVLKVKKFDNIIETVHNYIDFSDDSFMIRKGAISAKKDEIVLIPISMKFGTLLCKAKGNPDYNYSLNHGAGRLLSRSKAKEMISLEQMQESMKGIYCQLNKNVIDESCFAYKRPEFIMESIQPNADIISIYTPILNLKDIGKGNSWKEKKEEKKKKDLERYNQRQMKRR
ncbi:MAG: RtcB family protein [Candidatus Woesearchaeota archaeon]